MTPSLRQRIANHPYLWIVEDASTENSLAVHDSRYYNLGTSIDNDESLDYLIRHGAEKWLESKHNGLG